MVFFIFLSKKLESPPVKIILMFLNLSLYLLITPSISKTTPLITPELIDNIKPTQVVKMNTP